MNWPKLPWSFFIALAVFVISCGFLAYALGYTLIINGVSHGHGG